MSISDKLKMGYELSGYEIAGYITAGTSSQSISSGDSFTSLGEVSNYTPSYQVPLTLTKYGSFPITDNSVLHIVKDSGIKNGECCIIDGKKLFPPDLRDLIGNTDEFCAGCVVSQSTLDNFASLYLTKDGLDGNDLKILATKGLLSAIVKLQKSSSEANVLDLLVVGISNLDSSDTGERIGICPAVFLSSTYSSCNIIPRMVKSKDGLVKLGENNTASIITGAYNSKTGLIDNYNGQYFQSSSPEKGNGTSYSNYILTNNGDTQYTQCQVRFYVNEVNNNVFGENGYVKKEAGIILPDKGDVSEIFEENVMPNLENAITEGLQGWLYDTVDRFISFYETDDDTTKGPQRYCCASNTSAQKIDNAGISYGKWQTTEQWWYGGLPSLMRIYLGIPDAVFEREICNLLGSPTVTPTWQQLKEKYKLFDKNNYTVSDGIKNHTNIKTYAWAGRDDYSAILNLLREAGKEPYMQRAQDEFFKKVKVTGAIVSIDKNNKESKVDERTFNYYLNKIKPNFPLSVLAICDCTNWGPALTNKFFNRICGCLPNFYGRPDYEKEVMLQFMQKRTTYSGQKGRGTSVLNTAQQGNWNLDQPFKAYDNNLKTFNKGVFTPTPRSSQ